MFLLKKPRTNKMLSEINKLFITCFFTDCKMSLDEYTTDFTDSPLKDRTVSVKKKMKDGTYKTYHYKTDETDKTLKLKFMKNCIIFNYERFVPMKDQDVATIVTNLFHQEYPEKQDIVYSRQSINSFLRKDADKYVRKLRENQFAKQNAIIKETQTTPSFIKNVFPTLTPNEKKITTKILSYSFDARQIDMNMIRKTNFQRIKGDRISEFCHKVVTTTQFNFEPIVIYYKRGERMLAEGEKENILLLILDKYIWLDLFIRHNMEILINIVEKYDKISSIKDKKSITKNIYKTILDHLHVITVICKYLCPYLKSPNDISDEDILKPVVKYFVMEIDCEFAPNIHSSELIPNEVESDEDSSYEEI